MTALRICSKGTIALSSSLHKKYKQDEGAILTIIDLSGGIMLPKPMASQVNELANLIAKKYREESTTLAD